MDVLILRKYGYQTAVRGTRSIAAGNKERGVFLHTAHSSKHAAKIETIKTSSSRDVVIRDLLRFWFALLKGTRDAEPFTPARTIIDTKYESFFLTAYGL